MTPYIIVTVSLVVYPILAWLIFKYTENHLQLRKKIELVVFVITFIILTPLLARIITVDENANWILSTFMYLPVSILLRMIQHQPNKVISRIATVLLSIIHLGGYLLCIVGFNLLSDIVLELRPVCRKTLSADMHYFERNISGDFDTTKSFRKVDVYKTLEIAPFLAYRIQTKSYDTRNQPLQNCMETTLGKDENYLYLNSKVDGVKTFTMSDSLKLK